MTSPLPSLQPSSTPEDEEALKKGLQVGMWLCKMGLGSARRIFQHILTCEADPCGTCERYYAGIILIGKGEGVSSLFKEKV